MSTSYAPVLLQLFDDYGDVLAGGKVYTYEAGTTTPLATYQDLAGVVPNTNPVVLDAAGRATIRLTDGVAYKYIVKDADDNTIQTQDNVLVGEAEVDSESQYLVALTYVGTPGAQGFLGGHAVTHSFTLPIDLTGAFGTAETWPEADFDVTIYKNGSEIAIASFRTTEEVVFETTGHTVHGLAYGDKITFYAPATVGTIANFSLTLVGDLA